MCVTCDTSSSPLSFLARPPVAFTRRALGAVSIARQEGADSKLLTAQCGAAPFLQRFTCLLHCLLFSLPSGARPIGETVARRRIDAWTFPNPCTLWELFFFFFFFLSITLPLPTNQKMENSLPISLASRDPGPMRDFHHLMG